MKRKSIIFVAYGIVDDEVRKNTIGEIMKKAHEVYPDYDIRLSFTSESMIKKVSMKGLDIKNVRDTLVSLSKEGVKDVVLQPLHIIYGGEYEKMYFTAKEWEPMFESIKLGKPLLADTEDYFKVCNALEKVYGVEKEDCLVVMGHGSQHYANSSYAALAYTLKQRNFNNIFLGTLEAYPDINVILDEIKKYNPKKVKLVSLLLATARHAKIDMAGDGETSWKSQIEKLGYDVDVSTKGLADTEEFRNIFIEHLKKAIESI